MGSHSQLVINGHMGSDHHQLNYWTNNGKTFQLFMNNTGQGLPMTKDRSEVENFLIGILEFTFAGLYQGCATPLFQPEMFRDFIIVPNHCSDILSVGTGVWCNLG